MSNPNPMAVGIPVRFVFPQRDGKRWCPGITGIIGIITGITGIITHVDDQLCPVDGGTPVIHDDAIEPVADAVLEVGTKVRFTCPQTSDHREWQPGDTGIITAIDHDGCAVDGGAPVICFAAVEAAPARVLGVGTKVRVVEPIVVVRTLDGCTNRVIGSVVTITELDPENHPDMCGVEGGYMVVPLNSLEYADE